MEIIEEKIVDMLTKDSVSILTQKFVELDGVKSQVGENHRRAFINSIDGRMELQNAEEEQIVNVVFSMWGDTPSVVINNNPYSGSTSTA